MTQKYSSQANSLNVTNREQEEDIQNFYLPLALSYFCLIFPINSEHFLIYYIFDIYKNKN